MPRLTCVGTIEYMGLTVAIFIVRHPIWSMVILWLLVTMVRGLTVALCRAPKLQPNTRTEPRGEEISALSERPEHFWPVGDGVEHALTPKTCPVCGHRAYTPGGSERVSSHMRSSQ